MAEEENQWRSMAEEENTINCIPEQVLEEILARLPVKSILRFKSVCKSWRSKIQSRPFIEFHRQHPCRYNDFNQIHLTRYAITGPDPPSTKNKLTSLWLRLKEILDDEEHLDEEELESGKEWRRRRVVRVMGPLNNGIYCMVDDLHQGYCNPIYYDLHQGFSSRDSTSTTTTIALCNPATGDYKYAPPLPVELNSLPHCRIHYGFGSVDKDSIAVDYKLVVIINWGARFSSFLSFVYSLQGGSWTKLVDYESAEVNYPEITPDLEVCPQRFFKGCWHWMAVQPDYTYSVLVFDLADTSFRAIGAPPDCYYDHEPRDTFGYVKGGGILVLNDHLAAINLPKSSFSVTIWMMMEYGDEESWTKIYAFKPDQNHYTELSTLVGISFGGGNDIEKVLFQDPWKWLISCNDSGYQKLGGFDTSASICWNTMGISTSMDTLEPL